MPPDRGNLAEYGAHLARALGEQPGVARVTVVANQVPGAPHREEIAPKVHVVRAWRLGSVASLLGLPAVLRRLRPDVVHVNAGIRTWGKGRVVSLVGAAVPLMVRLNRMRVVTTLHTIGETVRLDAMGERFGFFTRMGMRLASWMYLRSHLVTVTLATMRAALLARSASPRVAHVAHGTYGPRVSSVQLAPPRVLSFGFWGAFKDSRPVVEAVAALRREGLDAELVLAGGPHPYFPEIYERLVEENRHRPWVRFTGYVPEEELEALFTGAAVVVLPYRTNAGASGVLNLTRSYGRPVVISDDAGLVEQLQDEGGAALVFGSAEGLVDALRRVLTRPELQLEMGRANLAVAHRLTLHTQAATLRRLYDRVLVEGTHLALEAAPSKRPVLSLADQDTAVPLGWSSSRDG